MKTFKLGPNNIEIGTVLKYNAEPTRKFEIIAKDFTHVTLQELFDRPSSPSSPFPYNMKNLSTNFTIVLKESEVLLKGLGMMTPMLINLGYFEEIQSLLMELEI